jgi:hypothetical protein
VTGILNRWDQTQVHRVRVKQLGTPGRHVEPDLETRHLIQPEDEWTGVEITDSAEADAHEAI